MSKITYPKYFDSIIKEIKNNPRKCEVCGVIETPDNVILKWDGKCMCDDCAFNTLDDPWGTIFK